MQLGMIGLGRMGANMVRRLLKQGHNCVVFDMSPKAVKELVEEKAVGASSLADLVKKLKELPPGCREGDNANALLGGFRLWDEEKPGAKSQSRNWRDEVAKAKPVP